MLFMRKFQLALLELTLEERQILGMTYPLPTTNVVIAYGDDLKVPFTVTPIVARYIDNYLDFLTVFPKMILLKL